MNDAFESAFSNSTGDWPAAQAHKQAESARRDVLLRRLRILLAAGAAAFTVTVWLLVRAPGLPDWVARNGGPSGVVRQQLEALNRGDLRSAYDLFSSRYRSEVPFQAFRRLVTSHRKLFRTQDLDLLPAGNSGGRVALNATLTAADGERYVARFDLVQSAGRWWVDDLRWGAAPKRQVYAT